MKVGATRHQDQVRQFQANHEQATYRGETFQERRILATVISMALSLLVAFSRVYLGAHYLSDVLAAMAEGLAWIALSMTALYYFRKQDEA